MVERYYERHNWQNAQVWATMEGDPREVATELVKSWNKDVGPELGYHRIQYPETPTFIGALAELIETARRGEVPLIVEDGVGDSLCQACRKRRC